MILIITHCCETSERPSPCDYKFIMLSQLARKQRYQSRQWTMTYIKTNVNFIQRSGSQNLLASQSTFLAPLKTFFFANTMVLNFPGPNPSYSTQFVTPPPRDYPLCNHPERISTIINSLTLELLKCETWNSSLESHLSPCWESLF